MFLKNNDEKLTYKAAAAKVKTILRLPFLKARLETAQGSIELEQDVDGSFLVVMTCEVWICMARSCLPSLQKERMLKRLGISR